MERRGRYWVERSGDAKSRTQCGRQALVVKIEGLPESRYADDQGHGQECNQYSVFRGRCPTLLHQQNSKSCRRSYQQAADRFQRDHSLGENCHNLKDRRPEQNDEESWQDEEDERKKHLDRHLHCVFFRKLPPFDPHVLRLCF